MNNFKFYPNFRLDKNGEPPTFTVEAELTPEDIWPDMFRGGLTTSAKDHAIAKYTPTSSAKYTPTSIEYSADHKTVVVIWSDGDKTIVRRSDNDPDDIYMAFTAALAKKIFGSNSAVKRVIRDKTNEHQSKKKKNNSYKDIYFGSSEDTVEDIGIMVPDALEVDGRIKQLDYDIKRKINGTEVPLGLLTDHINGWLAGRGGATREEINNEIMRRWKEDE